MWRNKLRLFIKTQFGTNERFAEKIGITPPQVSRILNNINYEPKSNFFEKLHDIGCDLSWLFADEERQELILKEAPSIYKSFSYENNLVILTQINNELRLLYEISENLKKNIDDTSRVELTKLFSYFISIVKKLSIITHQISLKKNELIIDSDELDLIKSGTDILIDKLNIFFAEL